MASGTDGKPHHELAELSPLPKDVPDTKVLDMLRKDEAVKVLATYTGEETWTQNEEKKLRHKIDRRLLPILCITYGMCPLTLLPSTCRALTRFGSRSVL